MNKSKKFILGLGPITLMATPTVSLANTAILVINEPTEAEVNSSATSIIYRKY